MLTPRIIKTLVLLSLLTFLIPNNTFSVQETRIALVIGNSDYKSSPLKNPVNDATDMADILKKLGFSVTLNTNANQRTMERAIRDFGKNLRGGGVGLFYYAGHGLQVHGSNYLIPIGAEIESEGDVKYEAVDAGLVLAKMEDAGNDLNIIILDACRDNPFARSFRSNEKGLAKMDAPTGSILAYATAPGSVAADGTGGNGLYTSKLLEHMNTPGLKIEEVFKRVRIDVVDESGNRQTPWESSSLMGDFYFTNNRGISVTEHPVDNDREAESKRLELERLELERIKIEIERKKLENERKRIEADKKKSNFSSVSPEVLMQRVVARDGRFIKYQNGVVKDTSTGLEWYAGPDRHTSWYEAKAWVDSLNVAGGGWQMPTKNELKTLYQKGVGTRNMTPLLKTAGWVVWGEPHESFAQSAWFFTFKVGAEAYHGRGYSAPSGRGFAVRSRKE